MLEEDVVSSSQHNFMSCSDHLLAFRIVCLQGLGIVQITVIDPALRIASKHLSEGGLKVHETEAEQLDLRHIVR